MRFENAGRAARQAILFVAVGTLAVACAGDTLSGTKGSLTVEPVLDFGAVLLGHRPALTLHLQNTSRATIRLGTPQFAQPGGESFTLPEAGSLTLSPGAKATLTVGFAPTTIGSRKAHLTLPNESSAMLSWNVDVSGEGVLGLVDVAPMVIDFGDVGVGTASTKQLTLTNPTKVAAEVVLSSPTGDDAAFFSTSQAGTFSIAGPGTTSVGVVFSPNRMGPFVASVTVLPCPTCETLTIPFRGNGVAASFVVDPPVVNFGHIALQGSASRQVTVRNVGTRTAQLLSAQLGSTSSSAFGVAAMPATGVSLAPGDSTTLDVSYAPLLNATNAGTLRIATDDATSPMIVVSLVGGGDGPALQVSPSTVNFGSTSLGVPVQKTLTLRNVGTDPNGNQPLLIQSVTVTHGVEFTATARAATGFPLSIPPGQSSQITVTYTPILAGDATGTLEVASNDPSNAAAQVSLLGSAQQLGECTYSVVPGVLSFGLVQPQTSATLALAIRNTGANTCAIANVRLADASDPQFTMTGVPSRILAPGETLSVPVTFLPDANASFTGLVQFDASSHAAPQGRVTLSGAGLKTCLTVLPPAIDYGTVGLACQPPTRPVIARNDCSSPTDIRQSWIGTGTSEAFTLGANEGGAVTLSPGQQLQLDVTYAPTEQHLDSAPLFIDSSEATTPHLVSLNGNAQTQPSKTDTFIEGQANKVDVLFVVDNSGSMSDKQQNLALNATNFINRALQRHSDFHLGVTSTGLYPYDGGWGVCPGGAGGGEAGRLFPIDGSTPRIVSNTTQNAAPAFATNMQVGICHWWEEGLEAMRLALSSPLIDHADDPMTPAANDGNGGFLRDDAKLFVFFVTDADDSDTTDVSNYVQLLHSLKPGRPDLVSASGAIGLSSCDHIESVGNRYMQLISATGGQVFDICSTDWGSTLGQVADAAFAPTSTFPLAQAPDTGNITVTVDGVSIAGTNGSQDIWHYDPTLGDYGAVVFTTGQAPGAGAQIQVTYAVPCP